ncbi:recombinase family protein [Rhodococcus aetherivorans]|uniref:recombinase family protein n=1 Tax=Rhodococcus aetherivorans TaxID=191292 RepID=UPI00294916AD|nr:recombinase family protein [Rhodococcus aetherivorans]MDV6291648.1 recombinase family protein [Rhodococcus aetherivorans]
MQVAIYLRQSQDRDGDEYGIDRQRTDCTRLVAARWSAAEVTEYVDNDVSATARKPRPAYGRLLEAVGRGEVDVIVARHMDRLLRRLVELEELLVVCERRGTAIVTAADGIDTSTDGGRLVARILAAVAQGEVERKSARQRAAVAQAAAQGRWVGGRRAFGYEADGVTLRSGEAAAVEAGYRAVLAGEPLTEIAAAWDAAGFDTPQGRRWTRSGVRDVLLNSRYAGLRRHRPEGAHTAYRQNPAAFVVGRAQWPAVVPEETWRAAVAVLTRPDRRTGPVGAAKALLTGYATCGVCGAHVHAGGARRKERNYRCSAAAHLQRRAEPIEGYVEELAVRRLQMPDALAAFAPKVAADTTALRLEADVLRQRLDDLAADYADGTLTRSQLHAGTERIRARLGEVEAGLEDAGRGDLIAPLVAADDVRAEWARLSTARRRAVLAVLMDVTIHPPGRGTRTFRPETVEIRWRAG